MIFACLSLSLLLQMLIHTEMVQTQDSICRTILLLVMLCVFCLAPSCPTRRGHVVEQGLEVTTIRSLSHPFDTGRDCNFPPHHLPAPFSGFIEKKRICIKGTALL